MAELTPKPFDPESGFKEREFKGAPSYYAKPDLQQYFDSLEYALNKHSKLVLGDVTGKVFIHPDSQWNVSRTVYTLKLALTENLVIEFNKHKVSFVEEDLTYTDTMAFLGNSLVQSDVNTMQNNITNVLLIAEKHTVTFNEDPAKAGIIGPTVPNPLESSDVIEYRNFSLATVKGPVIPETVAGKEVVCVLAQFTFYFDIYWKPVLIQNFREPITDMSLDASGRYPILNKVLSPFGKFNWLYQLLDSLNSLALHKDGSNDATADLYINKGVDGRFKIISKEDYATTLVSGIVKIANATEVLDPSNNTSVLTPFGLYTALGASRKVYELGVWDMNTTDSISFPHGLGDDWVKAIPSSCGIFSDALDITYNIFSDSGCKLSINDTFITVERATSGIFHDIGYSSTGLDNRGYVIVDLVGVAIDASLDPPTVTAGVDYDLEIPITDMDITQILEGDITELPPGTVILSRIWSMVSGPITPVMTAVPGEPNHIQCTFDTPGTYVMRFAVTVSDGTDTSIGTDTATVIISAETADAPMPALKWDDGTTTLRTFNEPSGYFIVMTGNYGGFMPISSPLIELQIRSMVDEDGFLLADFEDWVTVSTVEEPHDLYTRMYWQVLRLYGQTQFRFRWKNHLDVWSEWSNVLECQVQVTEIASTFGGWGDPYLPDTGAIGASSATNLTPTTLSFRVRGQVNDPQFDSTWRSETYYIEYDPANVQALPSPVVHYNRDFSFQILGFFNCETSLGRNALRDAIIEALDNVSGGYTDPYGNVHGGVLQFREIETVAPVNMGGGGYWRIDIPCKVPRGTTQVNETLPTSSPPRLARRVRITGTIYNESHE